MRRKTFVALVVFLILILAVPSLVAACAQPAPSPTAQKTEIELLSARPADVYTVLTYALASFINQDSEWLKASAVSTGGVADSYAILIEDPARRAKATALGYTLSAPGVRKETGFYSLFIGTYVRPLQLWVTYDKDIKTLEDLAGKVVGVPREVLYYWDYWEALLEDAGVLDTIKVAHGGLSGNSTALIDGMADATFTHFESTPEIKPSTYIEQMSVRGELYFIDLGKERIDRVCQKLGHPPLALEVPPETLGPTQDKTIYVSQQHYWWGAGSELSEDIVYEITRIAYEHAVKGDFVNFHASGGLVNPDYLPYGPWQSAEDIEYWYHPGALKFYRDMGVPGL